MEPIDISRFEQIKATLIRLAKQVPYVDLSEVPEEIIPAFSSFMVEKSILQK